MTVNNSPKYNKLPVKRKLIQTDNCPCCSGKSLEVIRTRKFKEVEGICQIGLLEDGDALSYMLCKSCGFIFFNPRYAPETLSSYYQTVAPANIDFWLPNDRLTNPMYKKREQLRFNKIYSSLKKLLSNSKTVADFGGQDGASLLPFVTNGLESFVIDPSYQPTNLIDSRIRGFKSVEEFLNSGKKLDCAMSLQTCEHIYDPFEFLKLITSTVSDKGIILLEVPYDLLSMNFLFNQSLAFPDTLHIEHINFFSFKSLKTLAIRLGLTQIKIFSTVSISKFGGFTPSLTLIARKQGNEQLNTLNNVQKNQTKYELLDIKREVDFSSWLMKIKRKYYLARLKL